MKPAVYQSRTDFDIYPEYNDYVMAFLLAKEWDGKEVRFPEKNYFARYVTDAVSYDFKQSDYKIVLYMDSIGCLGYKLKLHRWKQLMANFDSTCQTSISYLFFLNNVREFEYLLLL